MIRQVVNKPVEQFIRFGMSKVWSVRLTLIQNRMNTIMRGTAEEENTKLSELTNPTKWWQNKSSPTGLTCPIGGAPIGGIIPGGIIPGGIGVMLGGRCPIGGIPMGGKWGGIPGGPI